MRLPKISLTNKNIKIIDNNDIKILCILPTDTETPNSSIKNVVGSKYKLEILIDCEYSDIWFKLPIKDFASQIITASSYHKPLGSLLILYILKIKAKIKIKNNKTHIKEILIFLILRFS